MQGPQLDSAALDWLDFDWIDHAADRLWLPVTVLLIYWIVVCRVRTCAIALLRMVIVPGRLLLARRLIGVCDVSALTFDRFKAG